MTADKAYAYDAFISYAHGDKEWVRGELLRRLEESGLRVCVDFRDFRPGVPSVQEMERGVVESRKTLLILTPAYIESAWAEFEEQIVQTLDPASRKLRLIPVLKATCKPPPRIKRLTYVNFADPDDPEWPWTQLLTALGWPPEAEPATPPSRTGWHLAHPYPMPPHFTGRAQESAMLTRWLNEDAAHPLLVLRAPGGFGKSALAWHWLLHDVDPAAWPRVVWWSFYETEASFDRFVVDTLDYLRGAGLANLARAADLSQRQQVDALLLALHQPGTLMILDGFERALRAYGGMDAAYRGDAPQSLHETEVGSLQSASPKARGAVPPKARDAVAIATVGSGPQGSECAGTEEGRQRDCLSPLADIFLRGVATLPNIKGKVLLTTRLRPCSVEIASGELLRGCHEEELTQMQPADAVAFFRALGIRGGRAEIEAACAPYGYHPLSLRLLAGLIVADPQEPGDITAACHPDVAGDLVARQHHVLERAYSTLPPDRQALLSRIACFRGRVAYGALRSLAASASSPDASVSQQESPLRSASGGLRAGSGGEMLDASLRDLISRGLLHHDQAKKRFDLHPIVRRYAYDRLTARQRSAAHATLRDYFAAVAQPERVQTQDDLLPVIELYYHTVRAGQYDEACDLFRDRLHCALCYQFGAYQLQINLLRALLPDGEDCPPRLKDTTAQAWALAALANSYSLSGQPRRAVPLLEGHNRISEEPGDKQKLAIGLGNLADDQLKIGALRAAEANLRRRIALSREIEDEFREAVGHQELGRLLSYRGVCEEAAAELTAALRLFEKHNEVQSECVVWAYRAQRDLLLLRASPSSQPSPSTGESTVSYLPVSSGRGAGGEAALVAARRALELADETARKHYPFERDYVRAHWLLGAAHRAAGHCDDAERHLNEALERCRRINAMDAEADILIELARLRAATGAPEEAQRLLEEALTITERSGYVLQGADAHLVLAQLAMARSDHAAAREHAQAARALATCDGPPDYTYKVAYDEAGAILEQLESRKPSPERRRDLRQKADSRKRTGEGRG